MWTCRLQSKRGASCFVFVDEETAGGKIEARCVDDDLATPKTAPSTFQEVWKYVSSCVSDTLLSPSSTTAPPCRLLAKGPTP